MPTSRKRPEKASVKRRRQRRAARRQETQAAGRGVIGLPEDLAEQLAQDQQLARMIGGAAARGLARGLRGGR